MKFGLAKAHARVEVFTRDGANAYKVSIYIVVSGLVFVRGDHELFRVRTLPRRAARIDPDFVVEPFVDGDIARPSEFFS